MVKENSPGKSGAIKLNILYLSLWRKRLFKSSFVRNGQFMTAFRTAAGQYFAAIGSLHAFTKTMYGFTTAFMGLKCTFHVNFFNNLFAMLRGVLKYDPGETDLGFNLSQQVTTPVVCERTAKVRV